jgi:hypothetical protein
LLFLICCEKILRTKKKTGRERRSRRLRPVLHHLIVALSFSTLVL